MLKYKSGELPTFKNANNTKAEKLKLFNHYLSHRVNSRKSVLENIIHSFSHQYKPENYYIQSSNNLQLADDSIQDLRSIAHLAVWEATEKYLWGISSKNKTKYKDKFDFCVFASEQVKFKLRTHLRLLNTNRLCGKLPDSDSIRNIYSKLPKLKLDKNYLKKDDYDSIAKENSLNIDEIKLVDSFMTTKTESGDASIKNDNGEDNGNKWTQLETENSESFVFGEAIDEAVEKKIIASEFNKLRKNFFNSLSARDKEILYNTKFLEFNNIKELKLKDLGKKFNLSSERVRQIAEKKFLEFKKIIIQNKKKLGEE